MQKILTEISNVAEYYIASNSAANTNLVDLFDD